MVAESPLSAYKRECPTTCAVVVPVGLECYMAQSWGISTEELFQILVMAAAYSWGPQGSTVLCHCDNHAGSIVAVLRSRSCKDKKLMHLLRCLFSLKLTFSLTPWHAVVP